jgi:hypothetical protein
MAYRTCVLPEYPIFSLLYIAISTYGPLHSTKTYCKHSKNTTRRISCHFSPSEYNLDYLTIFLDLLWSIENEESFS